jgi:hypothetical protein
LDLALELQISKEAEEQILRGKQAKKEDKKKDDGKSNKKGPSDRVNKAQPMVDRVQMKVSQLNVLTPLKPQKLTYYQVDPEQ